MWKDALCLKKSTTNLLETNNVTSTNIPRIQDYLSDRIWFVKPSSAHGDNHVVMPKRMVSLCQREWQRPSICQILLMPWRNMTVKIKSNPPENWTSCTFSVQKEPMTSDSATEVVLCQVQSCCLQIITQVELRSQRPKPQNFMSRPNWNKDILITPTWMVLSWGHMDNSSPRSHWFHET